MAESHGRKMFLIRGIWLKAKKPMPWNDFLKSDLLKELVEERKKGIDRFKKEEQDDTANEPANR